MTGTAFRTGLNQVRFGDYSAIRKELFAALGINNRTSFYAYASGKQEMKVAQANKVEQVFNAYGITKIWGTTDETDEPTDQARERSSGAAGVGRK